MPYIRDEEVQGTKPISGEGPVLIVIHGTGGTGEVDLKAPTGDRWWQPDSVFDKWLCEKIECQSGQILDSSNIVRFVWSGANSEIAREKAARALWELIRPLEEADRSISIIAHSHGGNIARRACELAVFSKHSAPPVPWSVICIGTPFFHYSIVGGMLKSLFMLAVLLFWVSACILGPDWLHLKFWGLGKDWYRLIFGGISLFHLFFFVIGCSNLEFRRHRNPRRFRERASFINLYSHLDEAIMALRSLNRAVRLMRQGDRQVKWITGSLGCAFACVMLVMVVFVILLIPSIMLGLSKFEDLFVVVGIILAILVGAVALTTLFGVFHWLLDVIITSHLRMLAFGNDMRTPMSRVETFPWPGTEDVAVPLPREIETAAEAHIADRTGSIYSKFRSGLEPNKPLLDQNVHDFAEKVLTGDELVHTVYYRIEGFVDLVTTYLIRSKKWNPALRNRGIIPGETD